MELSPFLSDVEERFLRYVRIDTTSDEHSTSVPSTARQWDLLRLLADELTELDAGDVRVTGYGCTLATLPATVDYTVPTVALLSHVDTSPAFSGTDVRPIVHRNYDGSAIVLPDDPSQILDPAQFPFLHDKIGEDVVTASGTTLLGADDKSGVTVMMALAKHLLTHPEIPHGRIRLCFTSDEEIGTGVRHIQLDDLAADVAYTLDGGKPGEVCFETFSADKAVVTISGVSVHPGTAFGVMVNALTLAGSLISFLPQHTRTPETTRDRQGFIHLYQMQGNAAEAELNFILRDFELDRLQAHGDALSAACAALAQSELRAKVTCTITPQYRNMRYWLEHDMTPVRLAETAVRRLGLEPFHRAMRGGTDGSQLTERGLPTPNIFTGQQNLHGPLEFISLQDMARAAAVCLELVQLWAQHAAEADV